MEKILSLSAETNDIEFDEYQDTEYMIARFGFLSTRPNSHKIAISREVLTECAPSVLGKWVVADPQYGEKMSHTATENIVGMFPKEQEVEFCEDEDGYLRAYANAVISKRYAKDFCNMFNENDDTRPVSIEATFAMSEDDENTATSFDIKSVCVLGHSVKPSCPESDISIVRFSEEEAEKYYKENKTVMFEFELKRKEEENLEEKTIDFATIDLGGIWSQLYKIMRDNRKWDYCIEGLYENEEGKFAIVIEDESRKYYKLGLSFDADGNLLVASEAVEVSKEFTVSDKVIKFAEPEGVDEYKLPADKSESLDPNADKPLGAEMPPEEQPIVGETGFPTSAPMDARESSDPLIDEELRCKMAELEDRIKEKEDIIMGKDTEITKMEAELTELRVFKANIEKQEVTSKLDSIMAEVKEFMDASTFDALYEEGKNCTMADITGFENKAKAMCFGVIKEKKNKGMLTFSMPVEIKEDAPANVWEKLKKNFN